jgi:small ligand-binding sensory domain FIST
MAVQVGVGVSESFDAVEAFAEAAEAAARELDAACDLAVMFAGAPHLGRRKWILSAVHERLEPRSLIGCGAGGVLGSGREIEEGPGAVVWALSAPGARIATHHFEAEPGGDGVELRGVPPAEQLGDDLILLADPYTFSAEALLAWLNAERPGMPVLGGLASAAAAGSASLFRDGDVLDGGAVACSLEGVSVVPCVSQGAAPVGPEMTVTAARGNVIEELASEPALERLREAIGSLEPDEQRLAAEGLMLGIVIDQNLPSYERGNFLVRPLIGVDPERGTLALGERVRVGQTVRMHVRDGASADQDLREALRAQALALGPEGAAGALMFTCNGRGSHMFHAPDHDATAVDDALGVPAGGFFCAGEIGPVGGRNFLHGFTATMAVFPRTAA